MDPNEIKVKDIIKRGIEECDFAIMGISFDGTTFGRQGAKYAPKFLREAFYNFNTYSYLYKFDLSEIKINDFGDVLVSNLDMNFTYKNISTAAKEAYTKAKLVAFLGGDHSISYPTISSLSELGSVSLVVLDAHHDIRKIRENFGSSGTWLRTLIEEKKLNKVFQLGMRDFYNSKKYIDYAYNSKIIRFYTIEEIREEGFENICKEIKDECAKTDFTYISIDMDVLDALYSNGVSSLSINGLQPHELIKITRLLASVENLKAIDIVEITPLYENDKLACYLGSYLILCAIASFFSRRKKD